MREKKKLFHIFRTSRKSIDNFFVSFYVVRLLQRVNESKKIWFYDGYFALFVLLVFLCFRFRDNCPFALMLWICTNNAKTSKRTSINWEKDFCLFRSHDKKMHCKNISSGIPNDCSIEAVFNYILLLWKNVYGKSTPFFSKYRSVFFPSTFELFSKSHKCIQNSFRIKRAIKWKRFFLFQFVGRFWMFSFFCGPIFMLCLMNWFLSFHLFYIL